MVYFWILVILTLLLILAFIPLPVKTTFIFNDGRAELYIYNYKINLNTKKQEVKKATKKIEKNKGKLKKKIEKTGLQKLITILHRLYVKLNCNKFKISMKSEIKLCFGLPDAAYTGILYGVSQNTAPLIYKMFDTIFKLRKFDFNVEPDFQKPTLKVKMHSIFYLSLANVIYMAYILYKYLMLPLKKI